MWCCALQRWIESVNIFFRAVGEDYEMEAMGSPHLSLQWPGTPCHVPEQGDLEASGMQQRGLSVSEARSEGDERNGGNVIRLGEDSLKEREGMSRGKEGVWDGQKYCFQLSPTFPKLEAGLSCSAETQGNCCTEGCPCSSYG